MPQNPTSPKFTMPVSPNCRCRSVASATRMTIVESTKTR
jgi:hypothetical protein